VLQLRGEGVSKPVNNQNCGTYKWRGIYKCDRWLRTSCSQCLGAGASVQSEEDL
jgi:hypothetical protein